MKTENKKKSFYEAPQMEVIKIMMEEGIGAGSTPTQPTSESNEVKDQWENKADDNRNLGW
ncbi:hypothetical protein ACLCDV_10260 [Sphingobacterium sp. Lzh-3]|jgi:hypothetical protein|uniref:hypothetical protein n=1 Tax=unclassified Sphingobacterium TaxID=2609468 RepID=UPI0029551EB0|nr:hypothetical protein [Sphingobacterium sp. UGAL515B_05]WON94217.1 hypothetical protein OK025_23595 [Sphingobacterium sp. UGAL515B_05]